MIKFSNTICFFVLNFGLLSFRIVSDFACLRPARRGYAQAGASNLEFYPYAKFHLQEPKLLL